MTRLPSSGRSKPARSSLTRTQIKDLLVAHGLEPSRALGQNFLCDASIVDKIVRLSGVAEGDHVVEIGPGIGSLTLGLIGAGAQVLAVEIDQYLIAPLKSAIATSGNSTTGTVRIVNADARQLDWDTELKGHSWSVIANLPYNIATPLILDLLATREEIDSYLVMVQREVGERLAAEPGTRACGIPSVMVSYWGKASVVGRIPPQVFFPEPRVESVLVRIDRSKTRAIDVDFGMLTTLVKAGFSQRRKMLRRSLKGHLSESEISAAGVDPTLRAEALDLAGWGALTRAVA